MFQKTLSTWNRSPHLCLTSLFCPHRLPRPFRSVQVRSPRRCEAHRAELKRGAVETADAQSRVDIDLQEQPRSVAAVDTATPKYIQRMVDLVL